jgi:hypothetical protein
MNVISFFICIGKMFQQGMSQRKNNFVETGGYYGKEETRGAVSSFFENYQGLAETRG